MIYKCNIPVFTYHSIVLILLDKLLALHVSTGILQYGRLAPLIIYHTSARTNLALQVPAVLEAVLGTVLLYDEDVYRNILEDNMPLHMNRHTLMYGHFNRSGKLYTSVTLPLRLFNTTCSL